MDCSKNRKDLLKSSFFCNNDSQVLTPVLPTNRTKNMQPPHPQHRLLQLLQSLSQMKDELALQAHLMTLELKGEWQDFERRIREFERDAEHSLEGLIQKVGLAEAHFFVASEEEIAALVAEIKVIKDKHKANKH